MRRALLALAATAAVAALLPAPASAAEQHAYAAALTYATPVVVAGRHDTLSFTNLDAVARHDLRSDTPGLFASKLVGAGESSAVKGVERLPAGIYSFHCSLHSWMKGELEVAAAGGVPSGPPGSPQPGQPGGPPSDPLALMPKVRSEPLERGAWPLYGRDLANSRDGGASGPSYNEVPELGPVWSFRSAKGDFTGTPVVARRTLVAGAGDGTVYALNAATGKLRWRRPLREPINGSAAIHAGRVYVPLAKPGSPAIAALRLSDGARLWTAVLDRQKNADMFGSPVVWDMPRARKRRRATLFVGTSAEYGEVNDPKVNTRGSVVALDGRTGRRRWKRYTVPPRRDGGSVWSTPAVDTRTGRLYVGTGNAYHAPAASTTDSILALDARSGRLLAHHQATAHDVWNATSNATAGPDYDFGASPNLIAGSDGRKLLGAGQKSGTYWALDRRTLKPAWSVFTAQGAPSLGGIVGSTAYDGRRIYGPDTPAGEEWAVSRAGRLAWASSDAGPLQFAPVSSANGIVYTADMSGTLTAREAASGAVLAKLPLGAPSWGGVAIAGGYVFAVTGTSGTTGYVVAYRPRS
jgi:polyvinyl alcohol dehydrogenase (cytochrome)